MNVRELKWFGLAMLVAATMIHAARADGERPSQSVLNEMGLGGLVAISDEEASTIRGQGFNGGGNRGSNVAVFGNSFATINTPFGSAHSENGYTAEGEHIAVGANLSVAGVKIGHNGGHGGMPNGGNHNNKWRSKPWRGKPGMGWPGKPGMGGGNHGGGRPRVSSITFFAGGFSFAAAR